MVYTINEVADRWGTTRQSVKTEMETGKLKYFTFGSEIKPRYRIKQEWLDEFENKQGGNK